MITSRTGGNPDEIGQSLQMEGTTSPAPTGQPLSEKDKEMEDFVSVILADTGDVWRTVFNEGGQQYRGYACFI